MLVNPRANLISLKYKPYIKLCIALFSGIGLMALFSGLLLAVDSSDTIITIAGDGTAGFDGDGDPAITSTLNAPTHIAIDDSGNILIADTSNHRIRLIDTSGVITTIAGTGVPGFSGDGDLATNAQLNSPQGITIDETGQIIVADTNNHRIRLIDTSGIITTIAGTGSNGFDGDGNLAINAELNLPHDVALLLRALYFGDSGNHRIRKIDTSGVITTVAGTGTPGFSGDGSLATEAQLNFPQGLTVKYDVSDVLLFADTNNHRIRQIDTSGVITSVAGTGFPGSAGDGEAAINAQLNFPADLAFDSAGNLYIADQANHRIRKIDTTGVITTVTGSGAGFSGDGGPAGSAKLRFPSGLAFDADGNLYIADTTNNRVRQIKAPQTPVYSEVIAINADLVQTQLLTSNDGQIHIEIPPSSLPANAASVHYTPLGTTPSITGATGLPTSPIFGPVFQLDLLNSGDMVILNPSFTSSLTVTVSYSQALITNPGLNESKMKVAFLAQTPGVWMEIPVTNRNTEQDKLAFQVAHFTEFALFSEGAIVYLPIILR